ncbi:hypothetical protein GKZ68_02455 [Hymenobacter sp. BRD128]|uniref:hypothetical protein n=1 Tax=Hymenobacter sp. BRD128 TaxID=2675878 RepID=UPI0015674A6C|nr:hypothetical protein [Hymenobacter sp. BRD128]QKG55596.1 hypothetical protein GKZ68_02455 [Hymenobacter sp. BRD128]
MKINENLIKISEAGLPENFISVATKIYDNNPTHAAIFIRHQAKNYLHHFPGTWLPEVRENFEDDWYILKKCEVIKSGDENRIGSFLQYCRRICDRSRVTYGFYMDGSKYDQEGKYIKNSDMPELGTCVSFCVNTLSGALVIEDEYLLLDDWDDSSIMDAHGLDMFSMSQIKANYPDLDISIYNAYRKRISPLEYLTSGFFSNYPIKKEEINTIVEDVKKDVRSKFSD